MQSTLLSYGVSLYGPEEVLRAEQIIAAARIKIADFARELSIRVKEVTIRTDLPESASYVYASIENRKIQYRIKLKQSDIPYLLQALDRTNYWLRRNYRDSPSFVGMSSPVNPNYYRR